MFDGAGRLGLPQRTVDQEQGQVQEGRSLGGLLQRLLLSGLHTHRSGRHSLRVLNINRISRQDLKHKVRTWGSLEIGGGKLIEPIHKSRKPFEP